MDANDLYRSPTLSRRAASSSVPVVADALAVSRSKLRPGWERKERQNLVCGARWAINAENFALPMYFAWIWRVSVSDKKIYEHITRQTLISFGCDCALAAVANFVRVGCSRGNKPVNPWLQLFAAMRQRMLPCFPGHDVSFFGLLNVGVENLHCVTIQVFHDELWRTFS